MQFSYPNQFTAPVRPYQSTTPEDPYQSMASANPFQSFDESTASENSSQSIDQSTAPENPYQSIASESPSQFQVPENLYQSTASQYSNQSTNTAAPYGQFAFPGNPEQLTAPSNSYQYTAPISPHHSMPVHNTHQMLSSATPYQSTNPAMPYRSTSAASPDESPAPGSSNQAPIGLSLQIPQINPIDISGNLWGRLSIREARFTDTRAITGVYFSSLADRTHWTHIFLCPEVCGVSDQLLFEAQLVHMLLVGEPPFRPDPESASGWYRPAGTALGVAVLAPDKKQKEEGQGPKIIAAAGWQLIHHVPSDCDWASVWGE